jgi:MinD superfamily P-loop ATPase
MVCINKYDINPQMSDLISEDAQKRGLKVIGSIPYDEVFTKAQIMKATVIEYTSGYIAEKVKALWREVVYALG